MMISIVVPIYNVAKYIDRGMNNILKQDYASFEIILVDDGSTDGSNVLCDDWAQKDPRIRVVHQKNMGAGPARNNGVKNAIGEYIWFFDIDDEVDSTLLSKCIHYLEQYNSPDVLCFGYDTWDQQYCIRTQSCFTLLDLQSNDVVKQNYVNQLMGKSFENGFVWNKIYKKTFILTNDIEFPALKIQQDEVFNLRAYKCVQHLVCVPDLLYHYYIYYKGNTRSYYIADRLNIFKQVRAEFLSLYSYWQLSDKQMLDYVHKRYINSVVSLLRFNYNAGHLTKEEFLSIVNDETVIESIEMIKDTRPTKFVSCLKEQSYKKFLFFNRVNCFVGALKDFVRRFR